MGFTFGFLVGDLVGSAIERANRRPARYWYPATAEPPRGWYRDPAGSSALRWWDGQRWTDHIAPSAPDG
jgi:Protein of unknown function (DUF2510)